MGPPQLQESAVGLQQSAVGLQRRINAGQMILPGRGVKEDPGEQLWASNQYVPMQVGRIGVEGGDRGVRWAHWSVGSYPGRKIRASGDLPRTLNSTGAVWRTFPLGA